MTIQQQVDTFDRASLGSTGPNGAAYEGDAGWSIDSSMYLKAPLSQTGYKNIVWDSGVSDADISIDIQEIPASGVAGICFRYWFAGYYMRCVVNNIGSVVTLSEVENNSATTVTRWQFTPETPESLRCVFEGDAITVYFNGNEMQPGDVVTGSQPSISSFNQTRTKHGAIASLNTATGIKLDNWLLQYDDGLEPEPEPSSELPETNWGFIPVF